MGPDYGRGSPKGERVMVEYAQPNTHHSFHIGHFRNAVLGESLARLAEFAGFETIRASYPGRYRPGRGPLHVGLPKISRRRGTHRTCSNAGAGWGKFTPKRRRSWNPNRMKPTRSGRSREGYDAEVREMYHLWDDGDLRVRELWKRTRQWSLDELQEVLQQLDIPIDVFFYESEADEPGKAIVEELIARNIAEDERPTGGPVIVRIDEKLGLTRETYRIAVILRSDGTSLYLTKDLALAKIKFEQYHVDRSIYVVDYRQSLHFQQAFKILELWGFPQASKCYHLAYGIVTLPEGTMSSRKGNMVYYLDVVQEAQARIQAIIAEKNPDLAGADREKTAWQVGLGALKYAMLSVDNTKQIIFSWESALSFDGQAAPYIQYAHVRAGSILAKAETPPQPVSAELRSASGGNHAGRMDRPVSAGSAALGGRVQTAVHGKLRLLPGQGVHGFLRRLPRPAGGSRNPPDAPGDRRGGQTNLIQQPALVGYRIPRSHVDRKRGLPPNPDPVTAPPRQTNHEIKFHPSGMAGKSRPPFSKHAWARKKNGGLPCGRIPARAPPGRRTV